MKETTPAWDLSDLYKGIDDPQIDQDIATTNDLVSKIRSDYHGTITNDATKEHILTCLSTYKQALQSIRMLQSYSELEHAVRQTDQQYGSFVQKISTWATEAYSKLLFLDLEISHLQENKLQAFIQDPDFKNYKHFLERQLAFKPHYLSEEKEQLIREKALTGREALVRLFDQESSSQLFTIEIDGKEEQVHQPEITHLLRSPDRSLRKKVSAVFSKKLEMDATHPSFVLNMISQDLDIDITHRKFASPEAVRHLDNEVNQNIVDALSVAVEENYHVVQEYYEIKKKLLGLDELFEYDKYAPITKITKEFEFSEAKEIVLSSFNEFSPQFAEIAELFFKNNWIEAVPRKGKRSGAFCSYTTPNKHPYVFMSYQGSIEDVGTLAHELGHAINGYLARKQSFLHFDWPLTLAETSSVFCEMLVFKALSKKLSPADRLALYANNMERIAATVFRQISMYKFEKNFHDKRKKEGELSTETINAIWRSTQTDLYGKSLTLTSDEDIRWSYIPHFIHTPFYVYAYAFGELMTLSLYDMYKTGDKDFVKKYTDVLSAGGSASPQELLSVFNVDTHNPSFWNKGLHEIKVLLEEMKKLIP